jgi:acyl carrier protein
VAGSGRRTTGIGGGGTLSEQVTAPDVIIAEVTGMILGVLRAYGEWSDPIAPNDRLDGDLGMDSVEFSALRGRLADRWGPAADPLPLLAGLDLAGLTGLTVADLAGWVARCGS